MYIDAVFNEGVNHIFTKPVNQYSSNVMMNLLNTAFNFPIQYDIANQNEEGEAEHFSVNTTPISLPDKYFRNGKYIQIWIRIPGLEENGYIITIPVIRKPVPVIPIDDHYRYVEEEENLILKDSNYLFIINNVEDE